MDKKATFLTFLVLFSVFFTFLPIAWSNPGKSCFPIRRIHAGTEFRESMNLGAAIPTEICIELITPQAAQAYLSITLNDAGKTFVAMVSTEPKTSVTADGFETSTSIDHVKVHAGPAPRAYIPYNYYLFVDIRINNKPSQPRTGKEFVDKILRQMEYGGQDVRGEVKVGDEIFAVLGDSGWGGKDFSAPPPPPIPPTSAPDPDIECNGALSR